MLYVNAFPYMDVKERLLLFIQYLGITYQQFEIDTGLPNGYIENLKENVDKFALEIIINKYPDLNISWLLTGIGEITNNHSRVKVTPEKNLYTIEKYSHKKPVPTDLDLNNIPDIYDTKDNGNMIVTLREQLVIKNEQLQTKDEYINRLLDLLSKL